MHYKHFAAGLLLFTGALLSCKKEKADYLYDNRINTGVAGNSLLRLVNLKGNNQLIINGDSLTNFIVYPPLPGGGERSTPGTVWFPKNGRMGSTFYIPRGFLKNGKAFVVSDHYEFQGRRDSIGFEVTERNNAPLDYYIVEGHWATEEKVERVLEVPRDITAPAKPGYFKIRLVNIADRLRAQPDPAEDISRPLTLAFADGTPVSPQTSNVGVRHYSEYVELPYGTYQFKVLTPAGTEVTAAGGSSVEQTNIIDPATSNLTKSTTGIPHTVVTGLTYAPVKSYQPGGVYTIAVGVAGFKVPYYLGNPGETADQFQNGFRIISDISEPANTTYFRLQAAHAMPGEGRVTFRVNGNKLGDIAYGAHTGYGVYVYGQAMVEAVNAQGNVIASLPVDAAAGLNYTAWLYKKPDGAAAIALVSNNLSGGLYFTGGANDGQDGQFSQLRYEYPFFMRFLNFCADLPYASFTAANGQPLGTEAARNLEPGKIPVHLPYTRFAQASEPYQLMVFRSSPGVYPGNWISGIPVLKSTDFIARPEHYVRSVKPVHEPGIYTVALIGKLAGAGGEKARMIIVKHTK